MGKKDHDKLLFRLMKILHMFSEGGRYTIRELAEEFDVSERTIYRDLRERLHVFPIEGPDEQGRYYFTENWGFDKSILDEDELLIFLIGISQMKYVSDEFRSIAERLVKKVMIPGFESPYCIKPEYYEPFDTDSDTANTLEEAIQKSKVVRFRYKGKEHIVEPYKIVSFDGLWYLIGKDIRYHHKIRTYEAAKIEDVEILPRRYKADVKKILRGIHSPWFEDGNSFYVKIKVDKEIADYFRRKKYMATQKILKELDDGSLIVGFEVSHEEDVDNLIKAWLPHVEILEPEFMRRRVIAELERYLGRIKGSAGKSRES